MGILSFLGFEDEKEEQQPTAPAPATNSVQAPVTNSSQNVVMNSTMMKMNAPSNLSGGRRRRRGHKSKKHHKGKRHRKSRRRN